ncbi:glycerol-3-phosphate dehydrogenase [Chitinivorax tropicus]|uniref:Glycerol-3-phosphate dehydrogenase n=1 Tax=Chitinivorax tropicus TaxID=714531 RepID=A0A840MG55_9PROT|nr:glycerol-3-phosphate dehydrogenase [Chitinivorax tropicus]
MQKLDFDILVIGGGINGAGIARDAAGRGYSVLLCEKDDLAQHTSSASTKLIHGGLRYLEYYEFGLVRKALQEREVLLRSAPHIMWPLRFVMPHNRAMRPALLIRAGLFLYDHLARREILRGSRTINLHRHPAGSPLKPSFGRGFVYSDGWVQDARLVALCAMDAAEHGAAVHTRTRCIAATREATGWLVTLQATTGQTWQVRARSLVNAAGPWVGEVLGTVTQRNAARRVRLVKGSHIIVPRLYDHHYAYIFQNPDKRIIFAIPFEQDFTLIGTTDIEYTGDPGLVRADEDEINYLCDMASSYFRHRIKPADVVWHYSGVRPLLDDESSNASSVTRDYALECDTDGAPLLSVFGGKITTFRKLAEEAVDRLQSLLGGGQPAWTAQAVLPGGDIPGADYDAFCQHIQTRHPWLDPVLTHRYTRAYGTRCERILAGCHAMADLGEEILPGLYEAEARYLVDNEWARTAADMLWRRSKLGLKALKDGEQRLSDWLDKHQGHHSSPDAA